MQPANASLDDGVLALAADDLRTLAWLHAAERDARTWLALHEAGFPAGLGLPGQHNPALSALSHALDELQAEFARKPQQVDERLAADYADIYLTHALRASPCESVWLDEDHMMMQAPTFEVRACYRNHGMAASDWRVMSDDHLALELAFVAHLLERREHAAALRFLDDHLMRWLPRFARRVSERADTLVYAALAALTQEACATLRVGLAAATATAATNG